MRELGRILLLLAGVGLLSLPAFSQDGQSLGDLARQTRQQKQKDAPETPPSKPSVVISDDQPSKEGGEPGQPATADPHHPGNTSAANGGKLSAEQWKAKILALKSLINSLQGEIDRINASIRFAPPNCASGCAQRNERQVEKQQKVEQLRSQLDGHKKRLEDMQESARRQGYGTAVYDP
jgi:hypothetical protein